jgi:protein phosphatase PTC1
MFGTSPGKDDEVAVNDGSVANDPRGPAPAAPMNDSAMGGVPAGNGLDRKASDASNSNMEKKRRSSGVSRARDMFSSAKNSLHFSSNPNAAPQPGTSPGKAETPMQKLGKSDAALSVPQGSLNNSAGESAPGPRSTFRVGVTEDKNKKCRRTMEDTHAYLYNFLSTPAPSFGEKKASTSDAGAALSETTSQQVAETDNGYFAIFDGHAGTFAADWCGKKLHLILEETIKKNPNTPIPELLDQTFTAVDNQLEKLPLKNSGCTAVTAVLRWEDRVPNAQSSTGSVLFAPAAAAALKNEGGEAAQVEAAEAHAVTDRLQHEASRQRVLYTANVGDARIVLCRNGRALRLSYDHKGSDENEGRRVASAGGLILNNRVNGVLAVTRALGDAYMKDLVTGHPYTTETVIQADQDEFLILACDGVSEDATK